MTRAMTGVASKLSLPSGDARLLRLTNNAVFALPEAGVVVRITRSHQLQSRVSKVVRLARWFEAIDAPTIRLAQVGDQPVEIDGLLATIWTLISQHDPALSPDDLGTALRSFHGLGLPPFELPLWDPISDARSRLKDAEGLTRTDEQFLKTWCDRLEPQIEEVRGRVGLHLIHGDAHVGNLLRDRDGRALFCDFDATSQGPWQVDLVAVAVGEARFGRAGAHNALAASYGYDVTSDPDWPLLREARELKMVTAAVPLLASGKLVAAEFRTRLLSVMDGDTSARWTPFADLR